MANRHPSGRPMHRRKLGVASNVRWPRDGFLNPRLEKGMVDLAGGFGFRLPEATHDHLHHIALARKNRDGETRD